MKKVLYSLLIASFFASCANEKTAQITVSNTSQTERKNEIVEVAVKDIQAKLASTDTNNMIVVDANGQQVPYQITYDGKLIFPASVGAVAQANYTVKAGTPQTDLFATFACGKHYPERVDDVAWENDRIAFRAYGPALQATGEKAFGYDVWVKRVEEPVVEARYAMELNPVTLAKIDSLKKVDPKAAAQLRAETSYHVDHGNGLDCYKVGPTLGGGTSALYVDGKIVYPYAYKTQEILENGPLRFTVKLTYTPLTVGDNSDITETRLISLDKGSQLNKAIITYSNTTSPLDVATGIVLHEPDGGKYTVNAEKGYISYADPTDNVNNNNGTIYIGAVFPAPVKEAKAEFFTKEEVKERGADGHILGISEYQPGSAYTYYFGAGWSKWGFENMEAWDNYLENFAAKLQSPLKVSVN